MLPAHANTPPSSTYQEPETFQLGPRRGMLPSNPPVATDLHHAAALTAEAELAAS